MEDMRIWTESVRRAIKRWHGAETRRRNEYGGAREDSSNLASYVAAATLYSEARSAARRAIRLGNGAQT